MRRIAIVSVLVLASASLAAPRAAFAWGAIGHQTVGALADALIAGTHAEKEVRKLLGAHGTLASVSVWADCARSVVREDDGFHYRHDDHYPECTPFEAGKGKAELEHFVAESEAACPVGANENECGHKSYHFTDVAIQRDHYSRTFAGTNDHDVVAAIHAAIVVLQGGTPPPPFRIDSKRDALRILVHYVGDVHQPLHVAAVYLDAKGKVVDPDSGHVDAAKTSTHGGNSILDGSRKLHAEWDAVDACLARYVRTDVEAARALVPPTSGGPADWPEAWATDTIAASKPAFAKLEFGKQTDKSWPVTLPEDYEQTRDAVQRRQLIKAGARLAQLLEAIWP